MQSDDKTWYEGDRVWVPRISMDEGVDLTIVDLGDDDAEDPDVSLHLREYRPVKGSTMKRELIRDQFRSCKFSELQEIHSKRTKGGALRRKVRGMVDVKCECGCGDNTSGGMFKQGHDAKLKSKLRKIMDGKIESEDWEPIAAEGELRRRNWI